MCTLSRNHARRRRKPLDRPDFGSRPSPRHEANPPPEFCIQGSGHEDDNIATTARLAVEMLCRFLSAPACTIRSADQANQTTVICSTHQSCRLLLRSLFEVALATARIAGPRSILFCNHHKVLRLVVGSSSPARHVAALLLLTGVCSTVEAVAVVPRLDSYFLVGAPVENRLDSCGTAQESCEWENGGEMHCGPTEE